MVTHVCYYRKLQAILDLGFNLKEYIDGCFEFGLNSDPDVRVILDCTGIDGEYVLHSQYYDDRIEDYVSYGLDEKQLDRFLAFMKILSKMKVIPVPVWN